MKKRSSSSIKVFLRVLSYSYKYKALFFAAVAFSLVSVVFSVMGPRLVGEAVGLIKTGSGFDLTAVRAVVIKLLAVYVLAAVFGYAHALATNVLTQYTIRNLRNTLFIKLTEMPVQYLDSQKTGDLISRLINDVEAVGDGLISNVALFLTGSSMIIGTIVSMMLENFSISLVVLCLTPLAFLVSYRLARSGKRYFGETQRNIGALNAVANEMITGQKTVKAYLYERTAESKFADVNAKLHASSVKSQFISSMVNPIVRYIGIITYGVVGIVCVAMGISVDVTTAFLMYSNQYARPFMDVTSVVTQLQSAVAAAERIFAVLDRPSEPRDSENAVTLCGIAGDVLFDNVSFSYIKEKPLIKNLSISVKRGQKVAVVGPTGSGKTTLVNLLMRFYDVDSGAIYLDGHDIRNIARDSLRHSFGMVLQDAYLTTGTVRENIAYGKPEASEEEIIEAAKNANCYDFISALPEGLDTVVSDSLMNVSKGQKQLIFLARIMLNLPPLLILDEATSNIDTYIEARIKNVFDNMMKGRTSFVVAHRLSTVLNADLILVMNDGNVVEQGTHKELMEKKGFYSELYNSQYEN